MRSDLSKSSDLGRLSVSTLRWVLGAAALVALVLAARQLPVAQWLGALSAWVEGLGLWGPVVFALAYIVAALLFAPGSVLTVTAGAVFGLVVGTVVASLASTAAAALAFLIARYLARDAIVRRLRHHPRLKAFDQAARTGGWKVVALTRLSPAFPFAAQNYFYGLTGLSLWTCVLTSWLAMLPGTFFYVYLGALGRKGAETALTGRQVESTGKWVLLTVGLLATLVVTVYVTRLARQALTQAAGQAEKLSAGEKKIEESREPDRC